MKYLKAVGQIIILLLMIYLLGCEENNPVSTQDRVNTDLQKIIDSLYISSRVTTGVIVNIHSSSRGLNFDYAAGFSDKERKIPLSANHKVCIASNTKSYVAALILVLSEKNKLSLEDKLTKYFNADFVDSLCYLENRFYGKEITIKMLLNHTSGVPDFETWEFVLNFLEYPYEYWSPIRTIRYAIQNSTATNLPGAEYKYSNTNYNLLGLIAEKIEGDNLHNLLRKYVYEPSGIQNSYLSGYEQQREPVARGYFLDSIDVTDYNMSWEWACGGIMSSMREMNLFLISLFTGKIFQTNTTLETMTHFENQKYSLGILKLNHNQFEFLGHTGGALGYTSLMLYEKKMDTYFSIACNSNGESDLYFKILINLAEKLNQ